MTTHAEYDRQLTLANERLSNRTAAVAQQLGARLTDVQARLELTLRSLLSEQRSAHTATRSGEPYSPAHYWQEIAEPRAAAYAAAATEAIDEELIALADAVTRFRRSITIYSKATNRPLDRRATSTWIATSVEPVMLCSPKMERMNALGDAWQKKLRRAAVRRSIADLLLNPQVPAREIIAQTEMALLEKSPWVHGDRMLSAFELATTDIRNYLDDALARLAVQVQPTPEAKPPVSSTVLVLG